MYKYGFCHPSGMHNTISSVYPYVCSYLDKTTNILLYSHYSAVYCMRYRINVIDSIEMLALDIRTLRPTVFLMERK